MKPAYVLLAAVAVLSSGACDAKKGDEANTTAAAPIKAVAPPKGGDWTKMVSRTEAGGYVMGNPEADVKLIEFGSMTCPHCAEFDEKGGEALINKYVKTGRVSYEFRNFVRDPYDLTAALIARCAGPERFFPLTHELYADQKNWIAKLQAIPAEQTQSLQTMGPEQQFTKIAEWAGLQQWGAQHGVPSSKSAQCLTNQAEINQLVQMNGDATTQFPEFAGTPTFVINGKMLEQTATWDKLEPQLRDALGG
ncbi:DsbA family protein [Sphingomonas sp. SM33]|uniref:DsbA family protein n=1 Tax=Sphingomonas telluris TaxID=2907998 RepID=A0ABS9VN43_9SPHN|nr:thioredoxin domain-containing protein [Sphingomonas telluris]MCH8616395.1 DsbA family protein [Sphingomonas telluris]